MLRSIVNQLSLLKHSITIMPGQKNITSFFKPVLSTKRPLSDCASEENKKASKRPSTGMSLEIQETSLKFQALHSNIGESWFLALQSEFQKQYFEELSKFLLSERLQHTVFPPAEQVWTWTQMCSVSDVKVVILGQDPYHNTRQAHGLCFSVPIGVPAPPSLVNIYQELKTDIKGFVPPNHGNLVGWAQQGVLLLNACLTVRCNMPNSHKDRGWEELTTAVIKYISANSKGVVFLLWGAYAQKKAVVVDGKKHHLLKAPHPSPLSAHRGFLGCRHFSKCNELLVNQGKTPIDWGRLKPVQT